jgi:hypothetical protein
MRAAKPRQTGRVNATRTRAQPVDFLTVQLPDGSRWVKLTKLTDGGVRCCICSAHLPREALNECEPGIIGDVCTACAKVVGPVSV